MAVANAKSSSAKPESGYQAVLPSPIGALGIRVEAGRVQSIDFLYRTARKLQIEEKLPVADADCVACTVRDIQSYFEKRTTVFRLPYEMQGTDFQKRVWQALLSIPMGRVMTYGELAAKLGSGARAVGNACRHNPLPIVVPCHRVVGRHGPGGFSGETGGKALKLKQWLLAHENPEAT